jgi:hypothetical protein
MFVGTFLGSTTEHIITEVNMKRADGSAQVPPEAEPKE